MPVSRRAIATATLARRRSPRLLAAEQQEEGNEDSTSLRKAPGTKRGRRALASSITKQDGNNSKRRISENCNRLGSTAESKSNNVSDKDALEEFDNKDTTKVSSSVKNCLPRTREGELIKANVRYVMGIDEAGRGPLCGPVVAAACAVPADFEGITDSKKITKEHVREELYEQIVASPNVRWAVAVIDAARIDEINILQATLEGMRLAAEGVMAQESEQHRRDVACIDENGCYVVCGANDSNGEAVTTRLRWEKAEVYALVDGNRLPKGMPCDAESMVKGDSREYAIGAASILAKATRDRLMHRYDKLYPDYNLKQNKGYPTAAHMAAVRKHGASPIHRRSFAPLKHMEFDAEGNIAFS